MAAEQRRIYLDNICPFCDEHGSFSTPGALIGHLSARHNIELPARPRNFRWPRDNGYKIMRTTIPEVHMPCPSCTFHCHRNNPAQLREHILRRLCIQDDSDSQDGLDVAGKGKAPLRNEGKGKAPLKDECKEKATPNGEDKEKAPSSGDEGKEKAPLRDEVNDEDAEVDEFLRELEEIEEMISKFKKKLKLRKDKK